MQIDGIAQFLSEYICVVMRTGERIAERRLAKGLSQTQLAKLSGLSQATIGKLESGISSGSSHLHKIARALGTTPAYLSGETEDPASDAPDAHLSPEEMDWLGLLRGLDGKDRSAVLQIMRSLVRTEVPPTVHSPAFDYKAG